MERDTKVDTERLQALIAPALTTGLRPAINDLKRVDLRIPLEPGEATTRFMRDYRKLILSAKIHRMKLK